MPGEAVEKCREFRGIDVGQRFGRVANREFERGRHRCGRRRRERDGRGRGCGPQIRARRAAWLRPAIVADERHEAHVAERMFVVVVFVAPHDLHEPLTALTAADRHHEPSSHGELHAQRSRHTRSARRRDDRVIGRMRGKTRGAVADMHFDVLVAEPLQALARALGEARVAFYGIHPARDLRGDRGRIAGARANVEHAIAGLQLGGREHLRDDVRLRDRLLAADRQRRIVIREFAQIGWHECLARHAPHRLDHAVVAHAALHDLPFDHPCARFVEIAHRRLLANAQRCARHALRRGRARVRCSFTLQQ
ncbi:hypothetical protein OKW41_005257 [Paraburkholderia sp. UCT70]